MNFAGGVLKKANVCDEAAVYTYQAVKAQKAIKSFGLERVFKIEETSEELRKEEENV